MIQLFISVTVSPDCEIQQHNFKIKTESDNSWLKHNNHRLPSSGLLFNQAPDLFGGPGKEACLFNQIYKIKCLLHKWFIANTCLWMCDEAGVHRGTDACTWRTHEIGTERPRTGI